MRCLLFHDWQFIETDSYRDVSWGRPGSVYTKFLYLCDRCHKPKVITKEGFWNYEAEGVKSNQRKDK